MRKMRRLYRISALAVAILLPIAVVLAAGTTEASAATSYQYCYVLDPSGVPACLNAWGGGPFVNVETTVDAGPNSQFRVLPEANRKYQIEFVGDGDNGMCIGDAGNLPGNADTGLVACNTHLGGAGWGTLFNEENGHCNTGLFAFLNQHWGGYLGPPAGYVNGSHFYLNKPNPVCFLQG